MAVTTGSLLAPRKEKSDIAFDGKPESTRGALQLNEGRDLKGSGYRLLVLNEGKAGSLEYSGGGRFGPATNFLLLAASGPGAWIFPKNLVGRADYEVVPETMEKDARAIGLFITVEADRARNGDGASSDLSYYDLGAQKLTPVLTKVDRVISVARTSKDEYSLVASRGGQAFRQSFSLNGKTIGREQALAPAPL